MLRTQDSQYLISKDQTTKNMWVIRATSSAHLPAGWNAPEISSNRPLRRRAGLAQGFRGRQDLDNSPQVGMKLDETKQN